jgi:hypothetical protein
MEPLRVNPITALDEWRQAAQRVGYTAQTRAQWLIDLRYRYPYVHNLSPTEMRVLRWEMAAFCSRPGDYEKIPLSFSEDEVERWLVRIHNGIRLLTRGRMWKHRLSTHYGFRVRLRDQCPGESDVLVYRTLQDFMAHQICEVLAAVKDRLQLCQRKECGRLFVREKRQCYCTPACASVIRTRKHRAKQRRAENPK